ncbi:hypothetical protein [Streptosporangium sp. NPDC051022]|uniref:hypothetical protein n=1 Tax=Streptosporangium sp. NPDC051022 TaxID=3155752 RepID=UPI0034198F80
MRLLTRPYVTPAEFRASPTWLDTENLVVGGAESAQDAELANVLLRASVWADSLVDQPLGAHAHTEQLRVTIGRDGQVSIHAAHSPVRAVTALSYGSLPDLTPLTDLTGVWVEDQVQIIAALGGLGGWAGFLEFGSPRVGYELYVRLSYVAGATSTVLSADATAAVTSLTVADPVGIYPGDVLRLWDPGAEEAVTVAAGYVPGSSSVGLVGATRAAHSSGAGVSALPADVHQAVICRATALLLREPTAGGDDYADAPFGPVARRPSRRTRAADLIGEATALLARYRRVR